MIKKSLFNTFGLVKDAGLLKDLMCKLNKEQQDFLNSLIRDASNSAWHNFLEANTSLEGDIDLVHSTINGWRIHYVEDLIKPIGKCICNHNVRYICCAEHVPTGSKINVGSTCVQKYFNISMRTAEKIAVYMSDITCDRDEVLWKIYMGWEMDETHKLALESGIIHYSEGALRHVNLGLPILCKHEAQLEKLIQNLKSINGGEYNSMDFEVEYEGDI